jgi:hypothetical protein
MATSRRSRIRRLVRAAITGFVVVLLAVVTMGWIWTRSHQPPPLRTASHVVLAIAGSAGVFALARIWRPDRS